MAEVDSRQPLIVGLTLNYRDARRTVRCVDSLLSDGLSHVLVWDNSEDGGKSARELNMILAEEIRVSLCISEHNLGFAAGVNRAKEWIEKRFPGAWILLINNDAILLAGAMHVMAQALLQSPNATIAYPKIDHGGRSIGTAYYQRYFGLVTAKKLPGSISYASGCCQLLNSRCLPGVWFDETFFMYGEDMELGYRLGEQHMVHVPQVWVKHEGSASSGMGSVFYEARMVAAHWQLSSKLAKNSFEMLVFCLGRAVALPLRALVRACRYRSTVPFKSLRDGWCLAHSEYRESR
jgi:N-acetylglucosaminyl-diphospho-decaprenol L-rhamnosyltransferase